MAKSSPVTGVYEHPDGNRRVIQHERGSIYLLTPARGDTVYSGHTRRIKGHGLARTYTEALRAHGYTNITQ